jgi:S1-C subfamily serine protease
MREAKTKGHFVLALFLAMTFLTPIAAQSADHKESKSPWVAPVRVMRNGQQSGSGIYLGSGLVITAAHLTDPNSQMSVHLAGMDLPATVLKQGSFEDVDLSLLKIDENNPRVGPLPQMPLCLAPPWPGDAVIVVDAERATKSHIVSPQLLPLSLRTNFSTLIADVASTGNSGSGVFDPSHKCLLGVMSRKFSAHTAKGDKDIAKYFVPAAVIRSFIPAGLPYSG